MDLTAGPARLFPGHRLKFDPQGPRVGAEVVVVQWQNGRPVTIFPEASGSYAGEWVTP